VTLEAGKRRRPMIVWVLVSVLGWLVLALAVYGLVAFVETVR
jgi:hypothetical protein